MSTAARIDELRKKFEENPRRYFAPLANELRKAGNLSEAIALCRAFLPKQPEHMSGYIVFGQALYESGDLSEARTVFEQALALDPENLKALRHLGDIARWEGDTAGARRWYERVLEADPRNDDIAAQLATLVTPVHAVPVVPEPTAPATSWAAALPTASPTPAFTTSLTPPVGMAPIGLGAVPTPDAALRAVDFDQINARLRETEPSVPEHSAVPESVDGYPDGDELHVEAPGADASSLESSSPMGWQAQAPDLLDLDAIEAAGEESAAEPMAEPTVEPIAETAVDVASDDPFGFTGELSAPEPGETTDELSFEEGLIAPEWPDTAELVARVSTPRSVTPAYVAALTPDAVAAFGAEPGESMPASPMASDEVLASEAAPVELSSVADGVGELDELDDSEPEWIVASATESSADADDELPWLSPTPEAEGSPAIEAEADALENSERPSGVVDGEEFEAVAAVEAVAEFEQDADAVEADAEEADAVVAAPSSLFDEAAFDALDSELDPEPVEASFADVMPDEHNPAFVTETMGELLMSQGFTARAISVYEELVRRRPYDPVLTSRLSELREQLAGESAPVAPVNATPAFPTPAFPTPAFPTPAFPTPVSATPWSATPIASPAFDAAPMEAEAVPQVTARERFAQLAARRVPRRTPPRASVALETPAEGLESLFGGDASINEDTAARALADAFAPIEDASRFGDDQPFEHAMLGGATRSPTPMRSATPIATAAVSEGAGGPFSFDRFFPDPATGGDTPPHSPAMSSIDPSDSTSAPNVAPPTVSDDLAQFSAWLKGLGHS